MCAFFSEAVKNRVGAWDVESNITKEKGTGWVQGSAARKETEGKESDWTRAGVWTQTVKNAPDIVPSTLAS